MKMMFDVTKNRLEKNIPNPRQGKASPTFLASYDSQNTEPVVLTVSLSWGNDYETHLTWDEWRALTSYMEWQHSQQQL